MTSENSVTTTQTNSEMPREKNAVSSKPRADGSTSASTATPITVSGSTADPLNNGPTTDAWRAEGRDGQKQVEATVTGSAPDTKLGQLLDLLRRPEGTTLADMCAATGWQVHSVRGAMAGALRRKGHVITSEKLGDARRYRIETAS